MIQRLVLLAMPLAAYWVIHFKPLAQNGYLDPYIYTGYINNFHELFLRYGVTYYSVRFGLILPGQLATAVFGSFWGYFALRYVVVLAAGLAYWSFVKQRYGRPPAYALLWILLTSPFLARTVLWDHPDAVGVPFLLIAIALFLTEPNRIWVDLLAGVIGGMAVHSNIFVAAPLALHFLAYAIVWLARGGRFRTLATRLGVVVLGVVIVTAGGVAYYAWRVGQWDIFSSTIRITTWLLQGGTRNWRVPGFVWVADLWTVLTPVVLIVIAFVVHRVRNSPLQDSVILLGGLFTTALFYVHQFLLGGNSLQLHYYFSYLLPTIFLLLALIVGRLWQQQDSKGRSIAALVLVLSAVGPWVLYSIGLSLVPTAFIQHLVVVGVAVVSVVVARLMTRWRDRTAIVATFAVGVLCFSCFSRPTYMSMIDRRTDPPNREMEVYRLALELIQAVPSWSDHPGAIRFWYSNLPENNAINSIQSTYLWGYSKVQGDGDGLPNIGQAELTLLQSADVKGLILLAENPNDLPRGRDSLKQKGIAYSIMDDRVMTAGSSQLYFQRLSLPH